MDLRFLSQQNDVDCYFWRVGNEAFANKEYEKAIEYFILAKKAMPDMERHISINIKLAQRRLKTSTDDTFPMQTYCIDIIVPVYHALEHVQKCLYSLEEHTDGFQVRVLVIIDASKAIITEWLREFCQNRPLFTLMETSENMGYTNTVNIGLRASTADYVITQNSDTVATKGWLRGMVSCIESDDKIGIVGPLSNAAGWQSVPEIKDKNKGGFAVNELPEGYSLQQMANMVADVSSKKYPRIPLINAFCFMLKREVINAVGYMNDENFPVGYEKASDYCNKVSKAGFELAIADDVYIWHAKSKSFNYNRKHQLIEHETEKLQLSYNELNDKENTYSAIDEKIQDIRWNISKRMNLSRIKILVHLHLFHLDQIDYFLEKINNITTEYDLFVSTCQQNKSIKEKILSFKNDAQIIHVENIGYDTFPFWLVLQKVNLEDYKYVLKLHSKSFREIKWHYNDVTYIKNKWRNCLVDSLLISENQFDAAIEILENNSKIGMVGYNKLIRPYEFHRQIENTKIICEKMNIKYSPDAEFVCGTMFIIRSYVLDKLKKTKFDKKNFAINSHTAAGGTWAHSLETIYGILVFNYAMVVHGLDISYHNTNTQYLKSGNIAYKNNEFGKYSFCYEKFKEKSPEIKKIASVNISRKIFKETLKNKKQIKQLGIEIIINSYGDITNSIKTLNSLHSEISNLTININIVDFKRKNIKELIELKDNAGSKKINFINSVDVLDELIKKTNYDYILYVQAGVLFSEYAIKNLLKCLVSNKNIGVAGPLYNQCHFLEDKNEILEFSRNEFDIVASIANTISRKTYPKVEFIDSLCYIFKKEILENLSFTNSHKNLCLNKPNEYDIVISDNVYVYKEIDIERAMPVFKYSYTDNIFQRLGYMNCERLYNQIDNIDNIYYNILFILKKIGLVESDKSLERKTKTIKDKVVYTCITGNYDSLINHQYVDEEWEYICFTDNKDLIAKRKFGIWKIFPLVFSKLDYSNNNRWHKINPHKLFPNYEKSLYVDGNVNILTDYIFEKINNIENFIAFPSHFKNNCIYDELEYIKECKKDSSISIDNLIHFYEQENLPKELGCSENNIIFRLHNSENCIKIMELWWSMLCKFSKRDQATLAYSFWKNGRKLSDYLSFENARYKTENFEIVKHERINSSDKVKNNILLHKSLIDQAEVVSFDIFDTLVIRPYAKPTDLFLHIEEITNNTGFKNRRISAERQARKKFSYLKDITLELIYSCISEEDKKYLQFEIDFETKVILRNPMIEDLYNYSVSKKKKIIATSDMYLPKDVLQNILNKLNYNNISSLYVSSDINMCKSDGSIYNYVLNDLKISPDKMVHIGDNKIKDIQSASKFGIKTIFSEKIFDYFINKDFRSQKLYNENDNLECSIFTSLLAIKSYKSEGKIDLESYFIKLGYDFAGIFGYQFINYIYKDASSKNINDIAFVARDGYNLLKIFKLFDKNRSFNAHYIYAPRIVSASIYHHAISSNKNHLVAIVDYFKTELKKQNIEYIDCSDELFLDINKDAICIFQNELGKNYKEYFNTMFNSQKIAIVDLCTIWFTSQKMIESLYPEKNITGYYWRLNTRDEIVHEENIFDKLGESLGVLSPWDFMEFLFSSPEYPIVALENNNPIYQNLDNNYYEQFRTHISDYITTGCLKFCEDIFDTFGTYGVHFSAKLTANYVKLLDMSPSYGDYINLKNIQHASDLTHENFKYLFRFFKSFE